MCISQTDLYPYFVLLNRKGLWNCDNSMTCSGWRSSTVYTRPQENRKYTLHVSIKICFCLFSFPANFKNGTSLGRGKIFNKVIVLIFIFPLFFFFTLNLVPGFKSSVVMTNKAFTFVLLVHRFCYVLTQTTYWRLHFKAAVLQIFTELWLKILFHQKF